MSSYICSAKHFNSIQRKLSDSFQFDNNFNYMYDLKDNFPELYEVSSLTEREIRDHVKSIVDDLRTLNVLTVTHQYKHLLKQSVRKEIKEQTDIVFNESDDSKNLSVHGLYNALRCLYYQLEVKHVTMTPRQVKAYNFLQVLIDFLAHYIVRTLPDDKTNTWEVL